MVKNILVLTSGSKRKLIPFKFAAKSLDLAITTASFEDLEYFSDKNNLYINGKDVADFDLIYFRLVGKSLERASLIANYALERGVKLVDRIYEKAHLLPVSLSKAIEIEKLAGAHVSIPKTIFGKIAYIKKSGKNLLGFPFVIKSTSGKKGREVWSPGTKRELMDLIKTLKGEEKNGKGFLAQEFINASQRVRVLVVGNRVIGSITQPAKWRKRITGFSPSLDEKKINKFNGGKNIDDMALRAIDAVGLDIAGVDILVDEISKKPFIIEVNAAPSWKLLSKYCQINVEKEILKYLSQL